MASGECSIKASMMSDERVLCALTLGLFEDTAVHVCFMASLVFMFEIDYCQTRLTVNSDFTYLVRAWYLHLGPGNSGYNQEDRRQSRRKCRN